MKAVGVFAIMAAALAAGFLFSAYLADEAPSASRVLTETANAEIAAQPAVATSALAMALDAGGGEQRALEHWNGAVRIVNFWATWCAPCRREIPLLKTLQSEHGVAGIQVIGIAVDTPDAVAQFETEEPFNYPILYAEDDALTLAERFGVDFMALPLTLFLAPDGTLVNAHIGEFDAAEAEEVVPILLALAAGDVSVAGAREQFAAL